MKNTPLTICNVTIQPGERVTVALPTPEIYTCAPIYIPIHIFHGKKQGPTLLVCGGMHGDELNGIAISQKLYKLKLFDSLKGTLIVIPTINVYGLITSTRTLPDRRDIEGSFPGHKTGSFASRLAYFLSTEIFQLCTHCVDLHTGEPHIAKFPQVKTNTSFITAKEIAQAFQAPVILNTEINQGLLWMLNQKKIPTIRFETGEASRLDTKGIGIGVRGIVRIMRSIGMLKSSTKEEKKFVSPILEKEFWIRAHSSGLCQVFYKLGSYIEKGAKIATITDPFGKDQKEEVLSPVNGILLSINNLPILNEGEPIIQIAEMKESGVERIKDFTSREKGEPFFE